MTTNSLRWLSFAFIFSIPPAQAATLANFNFTGGSLENTAAPISGVTISPLTSDSVFLSFTSNTGWSSAAQISGSASFFTPSTHTTAGNAVTFTITAVSGFRFSLDGFSFLARSTATAPPDIGFKIGADRYDLSESYANNSAITNLSSSSLGYANLTSATISIQAWNSSGTGALQLDNIVLSGNVIPELSTASLCVFGTLILLRRRR